MAEGGREPEEVDFGREEDFSEPHTLKSDVTLALLSTPPRRGESIDEGLPMSPDESTPRCVDDAAISDLGKRVEDITGILAGLVKRTEITCLDQENLRIRLEELRNQECSDANERYLELELALQRMEDRLKEGQKEELRQEIECRMTEVEKRVNEEMDRRQSEYLATMEETVRSLLQKQKQKDDEVLKQSRVRSRFKQDQPSEEMMNQRVAEVKEAVEEAHKERDQVKLKFKVTLARLQEADQANKELLERIQELEARCKHLEEENDRLRLSDIVRQTTFTLQGPMLECFSCRKEYSTSHNSTDGCKFHPLPCMPYDSWRNYIAHSELPPDMLSSGLARSFHYWACCNVLANRRPEGCCHGRHHQQWEMDIMMRQVLAGGESYAFTGELSIQP